MLQKSHQVRNCFLIYFSRLIVCKSSQSKTLSDIGQSTRNPENICGAEYKYLLNKPIPWKYQSLDDIAREIAAQNECNDAYGRQRMYKVILSKQQDCTYFPSERAVYRVIENIGLSNRPKHKPNGITEADREAHKSDNLLKMDFTSESL